MKKQYYILILFVNIIFAQHHSQIIITIDTDKKVMTVQQELTFFNQTNDSLKNIVLNDWMNGYSSKNTPLAARFSDEFERDFHLASEKERGSTIDLSITDESKSTLTWERDEKYPDVIQIMLKEKLLPNQKIRISLKYTVKIPSDKFTKYGYGKNGEMYLKNCFLLPARYENKEFVKYNNLNLDDVANAISDYDIDIKIPYNFDLFTDLNEIRKETSTDGYFLYKVSGKNRLDFNLILDNKKDYEIYKNGSLEVICNLKENRQNDIQRALTVDKIVNYVNEKMGEYPFEKITISQTDYDKNPFYGLNQLPVFISPFTEEFLFEIKFLKTYINNYLHNSLRLDPRKDNWIYDGMQVYLMMKYIEEFHPESKMMGSVAKLKLLNGYNLVSLDFNGQYSYFYLLMARKNLDQPLANSKNTLIKFNEKIASKYKAGLSLNYLDKYLENNVVPKSIKEFFTLNKSQQTNEKDFENIVTKNSPKKIDWFFDKIIDSRDIIDYKFDKVTQTKDSVRFSIKTKTNVPMSIYGIKEKNIVFKKWYDTIKADSIYSLPRNNADKIVINYKNEIPEFNQRNNWRSLSNFHLNNRPIKFNFFKDLENPYYNQAIYIPTLEYNLYDGFLPGIRFYNKTILDKPFNFDLNPTISTKTKSFSGKGSFSYNQYNRDSNLYYIRYIMSGHYLHYAPDAYYTKFAPTVLLHFRPNDLRDNRRQTIAIKEVIVDKEKTVFTTTKNSANYAIFNAKFIDTKTEVTKHFSFLGDFQYSKDFGKLATEIQYRRLFDNNRSLNLRVFAGTFLHNRTASSYFDFGLDRPSDYLFESEYIGRSETKGIFSQQSIISDGFFKSILQTRTANKWMITTNANYTIWSWIEAYGDIGAIKNKDVNTKFVYDCGIRLNLVTDYFELFFPVYSSNGWEIGQGNYGERIRFIATFRPETLINLFARKWF